MDINLNVSVELGPKTLAILTAGNPLGNSAAPAAKSAAPKAEEKAPAPKTPAPKAAAKGKSESPADEFESLDEDAKLEAIKTEVTKHTKKGKSADIKALLTAFDAGRASELTAERYDEFYTAIKRYGAGETVEAITGGEDDLS